MQERHWRAWQRRLLGLMLCSMLPWGPVVGGDEPDFRRASTEALKLLQELVRADTSNPPGNEVLAARILEEFLNREGIGCEVLEPEPGRGNLICRLEGDGSARPMVVLAHLDVVGVDAGRWKVPPFSGTLRDGHIYGRGVLDDKGMAAAAAEALVLLARAGVPLARDLIFVGTADEESSGDVGIEWLLENRPELLEAEMVLNEGGRILKVDNEVALAGLQNDEKIYMDLKLTARGPSGHSSLPGSQSAVVNLARAIERLAARKFPPRITPGVVDFFAALAPSQKAPTAHCMMRLEDPAEGALCADILSENPFWNALLRTTCTPTIIHAGLRENIIPSRAEANLNCRLTPGTDGLRHLADLRSELRDLGVSVEPARQWVAPPAASPMDAPLPQAIRRAMQRLAPGVEVVPYTSPGGTDSRLLRQRGIPAYGLLPFPIKAEEARLMHADNERLSLESFAFGVRLMYEILYQAAAR
ncbi:MAG: M20/M25/M40 family metallo-hydrolase [Acidobacteriota bacterium]